MATQDLRQQVASQISSIEMKVDDLHKDAKLTSIRETIANLETKTSGFSTRITELRNAGYAFEKILEEQANSLHERWMSISSHAVQKLNEELTLLQREILPVDAEVRQLSSIKGNFVAANSRLPIVKSVIENFEGKAKASERVIEGMYSGIQREIDEFSQHLDEVAGMLRHIQTASFGILPSESGISTVKAIWLKNGQEQKGDPEGILFLTDQRLVFEQREEISTKKVLFISTEKKMVQQFCFEIPLACISMINTRQTGIFKNEDVIDLSLTNAFSSLVSLHIWQDNEKWKSLINRAKLREFDADRIIPIDKEKLTELKNLPTQCPRCGAVWSKPVMRGQESITCEYCGFIYRI